MGKNLNRWLRWAPSETGDNPYSVRLKNSLLATCRADYPIGMIPWLEEHYPGLHHELTSQLPDQIHRLWVERAPIAQFDHVLARWSEAHYKACELHVAATAKIPKSCHEQQ